MKMAVTILFIRVIFPTTVRDRPGTARDKDLALML